MLSSSPQALSEPEIGELQMEIVVNRGSLLAFNHYLDTLYSRSLSSLKLNIIIQENNRQLQSYLKRWNIFAKTQKLTKIINHRRFLDKLQFYKRKKQQQAINKLKMEVAENHHQRKLQRKYFQSIKLLLLHNRKAKQIEYSILKSNYRLFVQIVSSRLENKNANAIVDSIRISNLTKKYFCKWILTNKMLKLQKRLRKKYLTIIIQKTHQQINKMKMVPSEFYAKKLKEKAFGVLVSEHLNKKAAKHFKGSLLKRAFKGWYGKLGELFYEKQKQLNSDNMVMQLLQRKQSVKLRYYFEKWKKRINEDKQNRNRDRITRQYAYLRQKQRILREFFGHWKELRLYNLAHHHYEARIKQKTMDILKNVCLKGLQKWERVYQFIQNRQKYKYFHAIHQFNKQQSNAVRLYRSQKYFKLFCFTIIKQYYKKMQSAQYYHNKCLYFKTIYALKREKILTKKTNQIIVLINAKFPMKRWRRYHRVWQFVHSRRDIIKQKIFMEFKLMAFIRRETGKKPKKSGRKLKNIEIQQTQKYRSKDKAAYEEPETFEFEKLIMDSPDKLFSLDYSCSAYNSNPNPQFMEAIDFDYQ